LFRCETPSQAALEYLLDQPECLKQIEHRSGKLQQTPLAHAVWEGNIQGTEALLKAGANTNVTDSDGDNILHLAALSGKVEILDLLIILIKHKALAGSGQIEAKGHRRMTPLLRACTKKDPAVLNKLIELKANLKAKDKFGSSALHVAANCGSNDVIDYLIDNHSAVLGLDGVDHDGHTPLAVAILGGRLKTVRKLLARGADINIIDNNDDDVLDMAFKARKKKVFRYLKAVMLNRDVPFDLEIWFR
jgi:ankyrin repeat protein